MHNRLSRDLLQPCDARIPSVRKPGSRRCVRTSPEADAERLCSPEHWEAHRKELTSRLNARRLRHSHPLNCPSTVADLPQAVGGPAVLAPYFEQNLACLSPEQVNATIVQILRKHKLALLPFCATGGRRSPGARDAQSEPVVEEARTTVLALGASEEALGREEHPYDEFLTPSELDEANAMTAPPASSGTTVDAEK
jgi:hypothetical protein